MQVKVSSDLSIFLISFEHAMPKMGDAHKKHVGGPRWECMDPASCEKIKLFSCSLVLSCGGPEYGGNRKLPYFRSGKRKCSAHLAGVLHFGLLNFLCKEREYRLINTCILQTCYHAHANLLVVAKSFEMSFC